MTDTTIPEGFEPIASVSKATPANCAAQCTPAPEKPRYATAKNPEPLHPSDNPWKAPEGAPVRLHELVGVGSGTPTVKPHSFPRYGSAEWDAQVGKDF